MKLDKERMLVGRGDTLGGVVGAYVNEAPSLKATLLGDIIVGIYGVESEESGGSGGGEEQA